MRKELDPISFSKAIYKDRPLKLSFKAKTKGEARQWQRKLKRKLRYLLGGFPSYNCSLRPVIIEKRVFPNYIREKITFYSRPNLLAVGYLLKPKHVEEALPVVICLAGHGGGCEDTIGIKKDGSQRKKSGGYQKDFALQCVRKGFAVFALEQLGFGYRRDERACKSGGIESSCQPVAGSALLFGETMVGWRVYDVMRTVDYLQTREEIDRECIACMGISGGGTIALYAAALDTRIKVVVMSGSFNTFKDSIMTIPHCIDNYVPGILKYVEMCDIAGLVAPRPFFIESGTEDLLFPIKGTKEAYRRLRNIYRIFGDEDKLEKEIFEGGHKFFGEKVFDFIAKWCNTRKNP